MKSIYGITINAWYVGKSLRKGRNFIMSHVAFTRVMKSTKPSYCVADAIIGDTLPGTY